MEDQTAALTAATETVLMSAAAEPVPAVEASVPAAPAADPAGAPAARPRAKRKSAIKTPVEALVPATEGEAKQAVFESDHYPYAHPLARRAYEQEKAR